MSRLTPVSRRELIRRLRKLGFENDVFYFDLDFIPLPQVQLFHRPENPILINRFGYHREEPDFIRFKSVSQ